MSNERQTGVIFSVDSEYQNWFLRADANGEIVWIGLGGGGAFQEGVIPDRLFEEKRWDDINKLLLGRKVDYLTYEDEDGVHATDVRLL